MNRPGITGERCIALFLLGLLVVFNPPLLSVFNVDKFIAGIPVLFFYLFLAWGFLVVFVAPVLENESSEPQQGRPARDEPDRQGY